MNPMRFSGPQEMLDRLGQEDFVRNNPVNQERFNAMQEAFRTGDTTKVEQIARNICNGYNMTPAQMFQMVLSRLTRRN